MDLTTTKIVVAVAFGLLRFFFGLLPLKLYTILRRWEGEDDTRTFINHRRHAQVNCILALCQSFGGGVLFATCFLHMMLEVYNSVEDLKSRNLITEYPLSQLTICVGFFFVYFLEELSHWIITQVPDKPWTPKLKKLASFTRTTVTPLEEPRTCSAFIIEEQEKEEKTSIDKDSFSSDDNRENMAYDSLSLNSDVAKENDKNLQLDDEENKIDEVVESEIKSQQQILRCVFTILALSLHAIFEGLSIGLQRTASNIWYMFVAASIHSATMLFCIGLELLLAKTRARFIVVQMLFLAVATPLGIFVGLLVTIKSNMETKAKSIAVVLLEGVSAGAILYITFFEVLNREKERRVYRMYRALCIIAGFSLMAFLQYVELHP
ncbi:hypothetical protein NQ318_011914 [Aromia moschata]|uniref:Zinc transporter ZIP3 n=1 Tax=Aromia moschata TaxID=1265417 RepID=A0AAV8X667_9CUCU|nr:hypothetical protein NQ318_011914 [Aromia moschata]